VYRVIDNEEARLLALRRPNFEPELVVDELTLVAAIRVVDMRFAQERRSSLRVFALRVREKVGLVKLAEGHLVVRNISGRGVESVITSEAAGPELNRESSSFVQLTFHAHRPSHPLDQRLANT